MSYKWHGILKGIMHVINMYAIGSECVEFPFFGTWGTKSPFAGLKKDVSEIKQFQSPFRNKLGKSCRPWVSVSSKICSGPIFCINLISFNWNLINFIRGAKIIRLYCSTIYIWLPDTLFIYRYIVLVIHIIIKWDYHFDWNWIIK